MLQICIQNFRDSNEQVLLTVKIIVEMKHMGQRINVLIEPISITTTL